eukprot:tig00000658_g2929.t1
MDGGNRTGGRPPSSPYPSTSYVPPPPRATRQAGLTAGGFRVASHSKLEVENDSFKRKPPRGASAPSSTFGTLGKSSSVSSALPPERRLDSFIERESYVPPLDVLLGRPTPPATPAAPFVPAWMQRTASLPGGLHLTAIESTIRAVGSMAQDVGQVLQRSASATRFPQPLFNLRIHGGGPTAHVQRDPLKVVDHQVLLGPTGGYFFPVSAEDESSFNANPAVPLRAPPSRQRSLASRSVSAPKLRKSSTMRSEASEDSDRSEAPKLAKQPTYALHWFVGLDIRVKNRILHACVRIQRWWRTVRPRRKFLKLKAVAAFLGVRRAGAYFYPWRQLVRAKGKSRYASLKRTFVAWHDYTKESTKFFRAAASIMTRMLQSNAVSPIAVWRVAQGNSDIVATPSVAGSLLLSVMPERIRRYRLKTSLKQLQAFKNHVKARRKQAYLKLNTLAIRASARRTRLVMTMWCRYALFKRAEAENTQLAEFKGAVIVQWDTWIEKYKRRKQMDKRLRDDYAKLVRKRRWLQWKAFIARARALHEKMRRAIKFHFRAVMEAPFRDWCQVKKFDIAQRHRLRVMFLSLSAFVKEKRRQDKLIKNMQNLVNNNRLFFAMDKWKQNASADGIVSAVGLERLLQATATSSAFSYAVAAWRSHLDEGFEGQFCRMNWVMHKCWRAWTGRAQRRVTFEKLIAWQRSHLQQKWKQLCFAGWRDVCPKQAGGKRLDKIPAPMRVDPGVVARVVAALQKRANLSLDSEGFQETALDALARYNSTDIRKVASDIRNLNSVLMWRMCSILLRKTRREQQAKDEARRKRIEESGSLELLRLEESKSLLARREVLGSRELVEEYKQSLELKLMEKADVLRAIELRGRGRVLQGEARGERFGSFASFASPTKDPEEAEEAPQSAGSPAPAPETAPETPAPAAPAAPEPEPEPEASAEEEEAEAASPASLRGGATVKTALFQFAFFGEIGGSRPAPSKSDEPESPHSTTSSAKERAKAAAGTAAAGRVSFDAKPPPPAAAAVAAAAGAPKPQLPTSISKYSKPVPAPPAAVAKQAPSLPQRSPPSVSPAQASPPASSYKPPSPAAPAQPSTSAAAGKKHESPLPSPKEQPKAAAGSSTPAGGAAASSSQPAPHPAPAARPVAPPAESRPASAQQTKQADGSASSIKQGAGELAKPAVAPEPAPEAPTKESPKQQREAPAAAGVASEAPSPAEPAVAAQAEPAAQEADSIPDTPEPPAAVAGGAEAPLPAPTPPEASAPSAADAEERPESRPASEAKEEEAVQPAEGKKPGEEQEEGDPDSEASESDEEEEVGAGLDFGSLLGAGAGRAFEAGFPDIFRGLDGVATPPEGSSFETLDDRGRRKLLEGLYRAAQNSLPSSVERGTWQRALALYLGRYGSSDIETAQAGLAAYRERKRLQRLERRRRRLLERGLVAKASAEEGEPPVQDADRPASAAAQAQAALEADGEAEPAGAEPARVEPAFASEEADAAASMFEHAGTIELPGAGAGAAGRPRSSGSTAQRTQRALAREQPSLEELAMLEDKWWGEQPVSRPGSSASTTRSGSRHASAKSARAQREAPAGPIPSAPVVLSRQQPPGSAEWAEELAARVAMDPSYQLTEEEAALLSAASLGPLDGAEGGARGQQQSSAPAAGASTGAERKGSAGGDVSPWAEDAPEELEGGGAGGAGAGRPASQQERRQSTPSVGSRPRSQQSTSTGGSSLPPQPQASPQERAARAKARGGGGEGGGVGSGELERLPSAGRLDKGHPELQPAALFGFAEKFAAAHEKLQLQEIARQRAKIQRQIELLEEAQRHGQMHDEQMAYWLEQLERNTEAALKERERLEQTGTYVLQGRDAVQHSSFTDEAIVPVASFHQLPSAPQSFGRPPGAGAPGPSGAPYSTKASGGLVMGGVLQGRRVGPASNLGAAMGAEPAFSGPPGGSGFRQNFALADFEGEEPSEEDWAFPDAPPPPPPQTAPMLGRWQPRASPPASSSHFPQGQPLPFDRREPRGRPAGPARGRSPPRGSPTPTRRPSRRASGCWGTTSPRRRPGRRAREAGSASPTRAEELAAPAPALEPIGIAVHVGVLQELQRLSPPPAFLAPAPAKPATARRPLPSARDRPPQHPPRPQPQARFVPPKPRNPEKEKELEAVRQINLMHTAQAPQPQPLALARPLSRAAPRALPSRGAEAAARPRTQERRIGHAARAPQAQERGVFDLDDGIAETGWITKVRPHTAAGGDASLVLPFLAAAAALARRASLAAAGGQLEGHRRDVLPFVQAAAVPSHAHQAAAATTTTTSTSTTIHLSALPALPAATSAPSPPQSRRDEPPAEELNASGEELPAALAEGEGEVEERPRVQLPPLDAPAAAEEEEEEAARGARAAPEGEEEEDRPAPPPGVHAPREEYPEDFEVPELPPSRAGSRPRGTLSKGRAPLGPRAAGSPPRALERRPSHGQSFPRLEVSSSFEGPSPAQQAARMSLIEEKDEVLRWEQEALRPSSSSSRLAPAPAVPSRSSASNLRAEGFSRFLGSVGGSAAASAQAEREEAPSLAAEGRSYKIPAEYADMLLKARTVADAQALVEQILDKGRHTPELAAAYQDPRAFLEELRRTYASTRVLSELVEKLERSAAAGTQQQRAVLEAYRQRAEQQHRLGPGPQRQQQPAAAAGSSSPAPSRPRSFVEAIPSGKRSGAPPSDLADSVSVGSVRPASRSSSRPQSRERQRLESR